MLLSACACVNGLYASWLGNDVDRAGRDIKNFFTNLFKPPSSASKKHAGGGGSGGGAGTADATLEEEEEDEDEVEDEQEGEEDANANATQQEQQQQKKKKKKHPGIQWPPLFGSKQTQ